MKRKILNISIDDINLSESLGKISEWLSTKNGNSGQTISWNSQKQTNFPKIVVTPGPEFLLTAKKDAEFRKILDNSDLSLPDGVGLRIFGGFSNVTHGIDFVLALCELAAKNSWTVGLIGGATGVTDQTEKALKSLYPNIAIKIKIDGNDANDLLVSACLTPTVDFTNLSHNSSEKLSTKSVDILFVGLGHPLQEKFLWKLRDSGLRKKLGIDFKIGVGVGGSFDFISGNIPKPPAVFKKLQLIWLWRLIVNPLHFVRVVRATIIFPLAVLLTG